MGSTIVCINGAGNLVFHGPREEVVPFFESMHFFVPERKAVSDFLQEVTSKKDQKVRQTTWLQCICVSVVCLCVHLVGMFVVL